MDASPDETPIGLPVNEPQRLHPNVRVAWRIGGLIAALFFGGIGFAVVLANDGGAQRVAAIVTILVISFFVALAFWIPKRNYRSWSFTVRPHDLLVCFGVIWRKRICIPRLRIQHVDIESGPIERRFGLCHLRVYTAGAMTATVNIEGLSPDQAEALRHELVTPRIEAARESSDG